MGGWSIIALLFTLLVQAATGLFANDDILTEGPLFDWVDKATSDWLTKVHKLNQQVIIALIGLHVAAVLFYFFYKRQNLVLPMITGVKPWHNADVETTPDRTCLAVLIAGLAVLAVYLLVR
jgi:cytochrome b